MGKVQFSLEMEILQEAVSPVMKRPPWGVSAPWGITDSHLLCRWAFLLPKEFDEPMMCVQMVISEFMRENRFKIWQTFVLKWSQLLSTDCFKSLMENRSTLITTLAVK